MRNWPPCCPRRVARTYTCARLTAGPWGSCTGGTRSCSVNQLLLAALAVAFAGSLNHTAQWTHSALGEVALAVGLIAFIAWVNVIGVIWGGRLQMMFTIVKAGFLVPGCGLSLFC